ncbi:hypothetical protein HOS78_gp078 [Lactobacillus phage Bacchae]|uniref:Uncharacterized protein n=1 Tax=Lactobacillus phage Bacchae TaxID=2079429 RepID=A0A2K9VCY0_9CAUD|nr:hypothetical protein HOS78_gp078 [Lactobacillus phage Bacchae]AUV60014.1 hypothetical protein [Lactobacillus phage Bacchae]
MLACCHTKEGTMKPLMIAVLITFYCIALALSWCTALECFANPNNEVGQSLLDSSIAMLIATVATLYLLIGGSVLSSRTVHTSYPIDRVARIGDYVTVAAKGHKDIRIALSKTKSEPYSDKDVVRITDEQYITSVKLFQAMFGSEVLGHDKHYSVYLDGPDTIHDLYRVDKRFRHAN